MTRMTKYLLLGTGIAGFVLLGLAQSIFGPVLPVYAQVFGLEISSVSWVLSVQSMQPPCCWDQRSVLSPQPLAPRFWR
jgi:hypothetical protein